jgi:hypothetical protein
MSGGCLHLFWLGSTLSSIVYQRAIICSTIKSLVIHMDLHYIWRLIIFTVPPILGYNLFMSLPLWLQNFMVENLCLGKLSRVHIMFHWNFSFPSPKLSVGGWCSLIQFFGPSYLPPPPPNFIDRSPIFSHPILYAKFGNMIHITNNIISDNRGIVSSDSFNYNITVFKCFSFNVRGTIHKLWILQWYYTNTANALAINMKVNLTSFKYLKAIMDKFEKHGSWHLVNDYPTIYLTISFSYANSTMLSMLHVEDSKIEFVHVKHGLTNKLSNIMCVCHTKFVIRLF